MEEPIIFGSVCSGIEAASKASESLGWQAAFFSEIEKFPSALLAKHYPNVPNEGDMTKFNDWRNYAIRLLCGGTPCQSFSIAGLRKGMDDSRGNLALTFGEMAAKFRPDWFKWENVPGVLSSNKGRDFGSFLGLLSGRQIPVPKNGWGKAGIIPGYRNAYGLAYRVFDAQYFGVAQRRRRVFVVGYIGDWRPAAAVLLERESLRGNPAPSREKGKEIAGTIAASLGRSRGAGQSPETLTFRHQNDSAGIVPDQVAATLKAEHGTDERKVPSIVVMAHGQGVAEITDNGYCPTLTCNHEAPIVAHTLRGEGFDASEDGTGRQNLIAFNSRQNCISSTEVFGALGSSSPQAEAIASYVAGPTVRRLTPKECERLQGFPDNYTDIMPKGKPTPDGPRYKALGNSWAVPNVEWIFRRIDLIDKALRRKT